MCVFVDLARVVCVREDITGKRKSKECQASHNVRLLCLLDYLEYAMWVFVCLSLSFKVKPSQLTGISVLSVRPGGGWTGAAAHHGKNVK